MGLVKNCCKNGDYYWVFVFVILVYEGDWIVGYEFVCVLVLEYEIVWVSLCYVCILEGKFVVFVLELYSYFIKKFSMYWVFGILLVVFFVFMVGWMLVVVIVVVFVIMVFW